MPVTLYPLSRRQFLQASAISLGAGIYPTPLLAAQEEETDLHRVVLFSDTHIDQDPETADPNGPVNMTDYYRQCIESAMQGKRPAAVMVCGDCAYLVGRESDYEQFLLLTQTITELQIPVHCVLGNHDNLENFYSAGVVAEPDNPPVASKHVGVVETQRANWLLLDSLTQTDRAPGELGPAQLEWISQALDRLDDRPVLAMVHHNFEWGGENDGGRLHDADALLEVLAPATKVKAVFYGHSHRWHHGQDDSGIHVINLPPTSYVFDRSLPSGWVDCTLGEDHAALILSCLDPEHPQQNERIVLAYR